MVGVVCGPMFAWQVMYNKFVYADVVRRSNQTSADLWVWIITKLDNLIKIVPIYLIQLDELACSFQIQLRIYRIPNNYLRKFD